jgi:hypothetical protein
MSTQDRSDDRVRFLGIEIDRRINVFAITGFLLSIIALTSQLSGCLKGVDVSVSPPDQVFIFFDTYPDGQKYFRLAAQMNYVNRGAPEYVAIVSREFIDFKYAGKPYRQYWQTFDSVELKGSDMKFDQISSAQPVTIAGGASTSHSTVFGPALVYCADGDKNCNRKENFISSEAFLGKLTADTKLALTFNVEILGRSQPLTASCSLDVPANATGDMMSNNWYLGPCRPTS